jgi:hypothetical protein
LGRANRGRGMYFRFWFNNLSERNHWNDCGLDVRIILKWILKYIF